MNIIYWYMAKKKSIWPLTLDDRDQWPWPILCPGGHMNIICWNRVKNINLTFDLGWPWPVFAQGVIWTLYVEIWSKMVNLTFDLGWPWPILCSGGHMNIICWNMVKNGQFDLWPWMTLTCDLDLFCVQRVIWTSYVEIWSKMVNLTFDLGWPWMTLTCDLYLFCVQGVIWTLYVEIWSKMVNLTFDLGLPWPVTLTFVGEVHWDKANDFCLESIWLIFTEIWLKMSIWPWPWVTLDDFDLWPWPLRVLFIEAKLMAFVWTW